MQKPAFQAGFLRLVLGCLGASGSLKRCLSRQDGACVIHSCSETRQVRWQGGDSVYEPLPELVDQNSGNKKASIRCWLFRVYRMVRPERFELPTAWFVARYSIQLSYGRLARSEIMVMAAFFVNTFREIISQRCFTRVIRSRVGRSENW
jgi:hypothetical protein